MSPVISRLAPTPSGLLHLGNLLNFVLTWREVRNSGGRLRLRIDDCDATRVRPEFLQNIFDTLTAFEFDWDDGPRSVEDFLKNHSQTLRIPRYAEILKTLPHYACDCSRADLQKRSGALIYDGHCRGRNVAYDPARHVLRLRMPAEFESENPLGDFVLWRKGDLPAYQLASFVDDWDFGTTLIVRGEDLKESSVVQKILAKLCGAESFLNIRFVHHPLITAPSGEKLSKSEGAHALNLQDVAGEWQRLRACLPEELRGAFSTA